MIIPKGHRVLVKQDHVHEHDAVYARAKKAGLEISLDSNVRYQAGVDTGYIVSVGATAWKDFGGEPWAQVGDYVVFVKNSGRAVIDPVEKDWKEEDRTPYVLLNDEDVLAVLKE